MNSARARLKAVVLMLAMLLAMTATFKSWAAMPVAAMESAFIFVSLYRHLTERLIGGHDLVADRDSGMERLLGGHHGLDDLLDRGLALKAGNRSRLARFEIADRIRGYIGEDLTKVGADDACSAGAPNCLDNLRGLAGVEGPSTDPISERAPIMMNSSKAQWS